MPLRECAQVPGSVIAKSGDVAVKSCDDDGFKNRRLQAKTIAFAQVHIEWGDLLDTLTHPNPELYGGQRVFVIRRQDYAYLVPFVEDEHTVFLKTIIPSRTATKQYLGE
jgi:hypothetical protein